jgi:hypothetical protein
MVRALCLENCSAARTPAHRAQAQCAVSPDEQDKIERYQRSTKKDRQPTELLTWLLALEVRRLVEHGDHRCYRDSPDNLPPSDVQFGGAQEVPSGWGEIQKHTLRQRRFLNLQGAAP